MNRFRLAAAIPALTLGFVLSASANAHGQSDSSAAAPDQMAQSQSNGPDPAATDIRATGPTSGEKQQRDAATRKHPPTAIMDDATPVDKTAPDKAGAARHPPTRSMDDAAPDEKSRGSKPESSETKSNDGTSR